MGLSAFLPATECLAILYNNSRIGVMSSELVTEGVAKYYVTERVFTTSSEDSNLMGESTVVSSFTAKCKDYLSKGVILSDLPRELQLLEKQTLAVRDVPIGDTFLDDKRVKALWIPTNMSN